MTNVRNAVSTVLVIFGYTIMVPEIFLFAVNVYVVLFSAEGQTNYFTSPFQIKQ